MSLYYQSRDREKAGHSAKPFKQGCAATPLFTSSLAVFPLFRYNNKLMNSYAFKVSIMLIALLTSSYVVKADDGRLAAVYFSDGTVKQGKLYLTAGRDFKLNIPEGGSIYTTDMITGEPVKYGKVRRFDLAPVRSIEFFPQKEQLIRKWRFTGKTKYNEETAEADYTPAPKEYYGEPYPVRYLAAIVTFNSGEQIAGHLYSTIAYLDSGSRVEKIRLTQKSSGREGQALDDLVYVTNIKMLDQGKQFERFVTLKPDGFALEPGDEFFAVTVDTLTPVPARFNGDKSAVMIEGTFGEKFYLAVKRKEKYLVSFPGKGDGTLYELAQKHIDSLRDFYNERKLQGVILSPDGKELLSLVNIRRRFSPTNYGEIGGEWDKQVGGIVEPWRLSLWRWKYDSINNELLLTGRGTFDRKVFLPDDPSPQSEISESLWNWIEPFK